MKIKKDRVISSISYLFIFLSESHSRKNYKVTDGMIQRILIQEKEELYRKFSFSVTLR